MRTTTRTILYEDLKEPERTIEVRVDNTKASDKFPFGIDVGCVDEWLSDADFDRLLAILNKAKSLREKPQKVARKPRKT